MNEKDEIAALRKRVAELEAPWQPIETAPRDGTFVLTVKAGFRPSINAYQTHFDIAMWGSDPEYFFSDEEFETYWCDTSYNPTHWMPLPTPPHEGEE